MTQLDLLSELQSREHIATYCGYLAEFDNSLLVHVSTSEEVDRLPELVELVGEHFILTGTLPVRKENKV